MISSETFNFSNVLINQLVKAQDPNNKHLNFATVSTMAQIFTVLLFNHLLNEINDLLEIEKNF